jgi:phage gpG-like protein
MNFQEFFKILIKDIAVDAADAFDRNFDNESFFGDKWKKNRANTQTLNKHGNSGLRGSINHRISGSAIVFTSSKPYAKIHNEGGDVVVTQKMKGYFWAMYYKSAGAVQTKKNGAQRNNRRNEKLSVEAQKWKSLALLKLGSKIKMTKRQFIVSHPQLNKRIEEVVQHNLKEVKLLNLKK